MLTSLSLRQLMLTCVAIPLLGVVGLGGFPLSTAIDRYAEATDLSEMGRAVEEAAAITHLIQVEGGFSIAYVGDATMPEVLSRARTDLDAAIRSFEETVRSYGADHPAASRFEGTFSQLGAVLQSTRQQVDRKSATASDVVGAYQPLVLDLIESIKALAKNVSDPRLSNRIIALGNFLFAKERAAVEQAMGAGLLTSDTIDPGQYKTLLLGIEQQSAYLDGFLALAPDSLLDRYLTLESRDFNQQIANVRKLLIDAPFQP